MKLYQGSVKDVRGPYEFRGEACVAFQYTDNYSVFDWGRMPDALSGKGKALALMAAYFFEELSSPEVWKEFARSKEAHALRKGAASLVVRDLKATLAQTGVSIGAAVNELGEKLPSEGQRNHYKGIIHSSDPSAVKKLSDFEELDGILVKQVNVTPPEARRVLDREVMDYTQTRAVKNPRLVPVEVIFRFAFPSGSSVLEKAKSEGGLKDIFGLRSGASIDSETKLDFPLMEMTTKLEPSDRSVTPTEALAISGLNAAQMEDMLLRTAWIAAFLKWEFSRIGVELADGKLEWALDEDGELLLVDAIGPDELRLLRGGVQLSKEFLRTHYRDSPWYKALQQAKQEAKKAGRVDWKKGMSISPDLLPKEIKELAEQVYLSLAEALTGKKLGAWSLDQVVETMRRKTS